MLIIKKLKEASTTSESNQIHPPSEPIHVCAFKVTIHSKPSGQIKILDLSPYLFNLLFFWLSFIPTNGSFIHPIVQLELLGNILRPSLYLILSMQVVSKHDWLYIWNKSEMCLLLSIGTDSILIEVIIISSVDNYVAFKLFFHCYSFNHFNVFPPPLLN